MRFERAAETVVVDAWDDEVRVLRLEPEQLVAHGAADEVGVERERADEVLDCAIHRYARATASISTRAPDGSLATSTVERAGGWSPTCCL